MDFRSGNTRFWVIFAWLICTCAIANGQVTAAFSATSVVGCAPFTTNFTDQSTGPVTGWQWDFGNGNSSNLQNPSATFLTSGNYTIELIVTDGASFDTLVRSQYIQVVPSPTPGFTAPSPTGCAPLTVNFSDTTAHSIPIASWLWGFGDGNTSTAANPVNTYNSVGDFTVSLTVTDTNGCSGTTAINNYVRTSAGPTSNFGADSLEGCQAPFTVSFSDSSTGPAPLTYLWDFGDGTTSTLQNPTHTYSTNGIFDVKLVVTDGLGCSDSLTRPNYISVGNFAPDFSANFPACANDTVFFTDLTVPTPVSWLWDFGDGGTSILQNPAYKYLSGGNYTVKLVATSAIGCTDSIIKLSYATITPNPNISFTASPLNSCQLPATITFTDSSTGANTYFWDFGDGNTSTLRNPVHTYTAPGTYTIYHRVERPNGCNNELTKVNYIVIDPIVASFSANSTAICTGDNVSFTNSSTSPTAITSYQWDFGDGNTSTAASPSHVYATGGVFDVQLVVTNTQGCTDTLLIPNYITASAQPVVNFSSLPGGPCLSDSIHFTDNSSSGIMWTWDFGTGDSAFVQNPVYQYPDTGCFDVTLTVSNNGCQASLTQINYLCFTGPRAGFEISPMMACDTPTTIVVTDTSIGADIYEYDLGGGNKSFVPNFSYTYNSFGTNTILQYVEDTITGCFDTISVVFEIIKPTAGFTANTRSGCGPLTVSFTDTSLATSAVTNWSWAFGDGTFSIQQHPTHTYTQPGTYDVRLIIGTSNGCEDTLVSLGYITVNGPVIGFSANDTTSCPGTALSFTDQTTSFPIAGSFASWLWDFGDGTTSNSSAPLHSYAAPGTYTVTLSVTDGLGCSATDSLVQYITITQPQASFTLSDTFTCPDTTISFTNTSTGIGISHFWDFGDGSTSMLANPTHGFSASNGYAVQLTVTDSNGCQAQFADSVIVARPNALFGATGTSTGCPPLLTNFTDSSSSDVVGWDWNFGDSSTAMIQNPSHIYTQSGSFDVTLVVTSIAGCRDTLTIPNMIAINGNPGTFTFTPDTACTPETVTFTATNSSAASYSWDFGDGVVMTGGDVITHFYANPGVFYPILVIQDSTGCQFSIPAANPVVMDSLPVADFAVNDTLICNPDTVQFTSLATSGRPIIRWEWNFGDGNTATLENPTHIYTTPGIYDIRLIVENDGGCTDTLLRPQWIQVVSAPVANIWETDTVLCQDARIRVADSSTYGAPFADRTWDMGDGYTDSVATFIHTYSTPGSFTISLTVEDAFGCTDTTTQAVTVLPKPTAAFSSIDTLTCAQFSVNFMDQSSPVTTWEWDFGDGNADSVANPVHIYPGRGQYDVTLVVTDAAGCTDTVLAPNYIRVFQPIAGFTASAATGCLPQPVTFTDTSLSDTTLAMWQWNFGDGNIGTGTPVTHTYNQLGTFDVFLSVTDAIGCRDTITIANALEFSVPQTPAIWNVSVLSHTSDSLTFQADTSALFDHYRIQREIPTGSGIFITIDSILTATDTVYIDTTASPGQQSHCYLVQTVDVCGNVSNPNDAQPHCTISLDAMPGINSVLLSWSPYIGADSVISYELLEVSDYSQPLNSIAILPATQTTYVDTNLACAVPRSYRIRATLAGTNANYSWSDTAQATPVHEPLSIAPEVLFATVIDNEDVQVTWTLPQVPFARRITVERSEDNANWNNWVVNLPAGTTIVVDTSAAIFAQSYYYRVRVVDECGLITPLSNIGRSILLTLQNATGAVELNWNAYAEWGNGVQEYRIEIQSQSATAWSQLAVIPATQGTASYSFTDNITSFKNEIYCYRVIAIENGGNGASSMSNETCMSPEIWIPNTVTPNGDGANDFFAIPALSLYPENSLQIFNRWGDQVYSQSEYQGDWDGTNSKNGEPLPDGTYYYLLEIPVLNQVFKGYVMILR